MNDDEQRLKRLPLVQPSTHLDTRMDRLFAAAPQHAPRLRVVPLRFALAACALSVAVGAAFATFIQKEPQTPAPSVRVVYIDRPAAASAANAYDWSRTPVPRLWDAPSETLVVNTLRPAVPASPATESSS